MSIVPIFKRRIFTRKVIYRLFQLNVWTFQKCKNAHACALRDCLGVSQPFVSDTSLKCIDREGLKRCRTGTRQVLLDSLLSKMKVVTMRKMKAKMRKLFRTLKLLNVLKSVYHGWKDRTMLMLFRLCSFEEWWNSRCACKVLPWYELTYFNILGQCKNINFNC